MRERGRVKREWEGRRGTGRMRKGGIEKVGGRRGTGRMRKGGIEKRRGGGLKRGGGRLKEGVREKGGGPGGLKEGVGRLRERGRRRVGGRRRCGENIDFFLFLLYSYEDIRVYACTRLQQF